MSADSFRRWVLCAGAVILVAIVAHAQGISTSLSPDTSQFATQAQVMAAIQSNSPVTSVNGSQGNVVVSTVQRQSSLALDISSGSATWTYPVPFKNPPTCYPTISPGNSAYIYSFPTPTADPTTTSVTFTALAALKVLNISLGLTTIWGPPPAGTKLTLPCVGALP